MPARVVLVHDDPEFVGPLRDAIQASGYDVAVFPDSMVALDALDAAQTVNC